VASQLHVDTTPMRSALVGFRFVCVEEEHAGTVDVKYGTEKPFGAFPEVDPPIRTLHLRMEESTGLERDTKLQLSSEWGRANTALTGGRNRAASIPATAITISTTVTTCENVNDGCPSLCGILPRVCWGD